MSRLRVGIALLIIGLVLMIVGAGVTTNTAAGRSDAERMALRIDAVLDQVGEPPFFYAENLDPYWVFEVGPYFAYEGLTAEKFTPPTVVFEPLIDGGSHNHLLGYTYCEDEVFLNIRVLNTESAWYGWERNPLATLIHEMVHTLGGDFCSYDSTVTESSTQTGTLEILAALANGGNKVALYSLLVELEDMATDVVLADALQRNDLDSYREFRQRIDPEAVEEARFEKSMRFWSTDMDTLKDILTKYSVRVFQTVQTGQLGADLPDQRGIGDGDKDIVLLDDLVYVLDNLEDLAEDAFDDDPR